MLDEYSWLTDEVIAAEAGDPYYRNGLDAHLEREKGHYLRKSVGNTPAMEEIRAMPWDAFVARYRSWKERQKGACEACGGTGEYLSHPQGTPGPCPDCQESDDLFAGEYRSNFRKPQTLAEFFADDNRAHESCLRWQNERRAVRDAQARAIRAVVLDDCHVAALVVEGER